MRVFYRNQRGKFLWIVIRIRLHHKICESIYDF